MSINNYILTVDIGSCSLKIAEFMHHNDKLLLVNFDYIEYSLNLEDSEKIAAVNNKFSSIAASKKFTAKKVYISISGQTTFTRFVNLPPVQSKEEKINQIVNYEAKQNIPFPIEEVTWDYQLISDADKTNEEIKVMFTVIKTDLITEIVNIFEKLEFETKLVGTSLTATYNCISAAKLSDDTSVAVVNIGSRCTTIVFADQGKFFSRTIPLAGHTITQQISKELEIPFEKAEELKRNIGFVSLGSNYEETDSELADQVAKIIRNVMLRLNGEVNRSINVFRAQQQGNKPTKIFLGGGSSILKYADKFLADRLSIPVEYFNPFTLISISNEIDKVKLSSIGHMFAEVTGLAVNSIATCPVEISLLPESIKRQHRIKRKTPFFYATACAIIISLGIIYWGLSAQNQMVDNLIISSNHQTRKIQRGVNVVKKLLRTLRSEEATYSKLSEMLDGRNTWFELLDSVQKSLPDNTWIVQLSPTGKPTITNTETKTKPSRSLFGRRRTKYPKKILTTESSSRNIEWIKIKAHTLVIHKNLKITGAERFKKSLLASSFFTNETDKIVIVDFKTNREGSNNINTFDIIVKLKKSIKL
ncbi:MAG TPA: type IV pilus assembly protein PilM [Victivallales bacterium]|nr:type IV pilus assembly protein PilM [Victivallales bacterium]